MAHKVETQWMGKMQFNALVNGHTIVMDGPEKVGGEDNGPIPKPFVLTALSGCTGMDVVSILRKQGIEVNDFNIVVTGEISKPHPIVYTSIHLIYEFKGNEAYKEVVLKAVTDSQEKFCGVSNMLKRILPVTWDVTYNGITIFSNQKEESAIELYPII
ncbi:MAG TPA: OsmC family protein [Flavisolibacter sp.]|nr:OsmC family protein [Flavisolibacter sp.]